MVVINTGFTGAVIIIIIFIGVTGIDIKVGLLVQLILLLFILKTLILLSKLRSCCVRIISCGTFGKEQLCSVQRYILLGNTKKVRIYFQLI